MNRIIIDLTGAGGLADNHYTGRDGQDFNNLKLQTGEGDYLIYEANNLVRPGYSYPNINEYESQNVIFAASGVKNVVSALYTEDMEGYAIAMNNWIHSRSSTANTTFQAENGVEIVDAVNYEVRGKPSIVFATLYKEEADFFNNSEDEIDTVTNLNSENTNNSLPTLAGYRDGGIFYNGLYIAPAFSDGLVYSYDGFSWETVELSIDRTTQIAETTNVYENDIVIFGGEGDPILYGDSPTGPFSDVSSGSGDSTEIANIDFRGSATGGGWVVGVGFDAGTNSGDTIAFTNAPPDEATWETSLPGQNFSINSVAYSPSLNRFVIVGEQLGTGNPKAYYADANQGSLQSPTDVSSEFVDPLKVVHWFDGIFWAFDHAQTSRLYTSPDGINWNPNPTFPQVNVVAAADDGHTLALKTDETNPSVIYVFTDGSSDNYNNPEIASSNAGIIAGKGAFVILGSGSSYIVKNDRKITALTGEDLVSVGFYKPDIEVGVDEVSSRVTEIYPNSYENVYISFGSGQPWSSEYEKFFQPILVSHLDDRKVGKVRIKMNVHSSGTINVRVAMHDSTNSTGASFNDTEVDSETYTFSGATEEKEFDVYVDFEGTQFAENVKYGAISVSIDSVPTFTSADFAYIEPIVTQKGLSLYENLHASNGGNSSFYGNQSLDISIIKDSTSFWSSKFATNARPLPVKDDYIPFIVPADNGFLYIFTGNQVHSLDGGKTGGPRGILRRNLLAFPDYLDIVDAVDRKSRLYMAIQSVRANRDQISGLENKLGLNSDVVGVYIWDKISLAVNYQEFVPIPGVTEIKKLFIDSVGRVNAFVVTNDGMTEIRTYSQGEFVTNKILGQNKYPVLRRNPTFFGPYYTWTDSQGVMHMWGNKDGGTTMEYYEGVDINTISGANGSTGVEALLLPQTVGVNKKDQELNIFVGTSDGYERRVIIPFDYTGTKTLKGKILTPVRPVNSLSTIKYVRGFHARFEDGKDFVNPPVVRMYTNMSATPLWEHTVTKEEVEKGYFEKEINHQNINFVQFEVEWPESTGDQKIYAPFMLELWNAPESRQAAGR